jgi:hypothetical protein
MPQANSLEFLLMGKNDGFCLKNILILSLFFEDIFTGYGILSQYLSLSGYYSNVFD